MKKKAKIAQKATEKGQTTDNGQSIPKSGLLTGQDAAEAKISVSDHFHNELGQFISGNPGKAKRFDNKEDLQAAIVKYFEFCHREKRKLTMTGLAIALGFRSRQALINYEREPGYEFAYDIILYSKMKIEEYTEERLHDQRANIVGAIFSLKNNWGWQDRQDIRMDQRKITIKGMEWINPNDDGNDGD